MPGIIEPEILTYLDGLASRDDKLLDEMYAYAREHSQPVLDRQSARFLSVLVMALRPMLVVEIGCNIGVSALHIARAMPEGRLITFDTNPEIVEVANGYFKRAGVAEGIDARVVSGLGGLEDIPEGSVDLAFIDADKENYSNYLDALFPRLRPGGVLTADNLLWRGTVVHPDPEKPGSVELAEFNRKLMSHPGFEAAILPVGDGIGFAVKTG